VPSRKRCEATEAAQTGWSGLPKCFGMPSLEDGTILDAIRKDAPDVGGCREKETGQPFNVYALNPQKGEVQ
jgi:hypothetical protein